MKELKIGQEEWSTYNRNNIHLEGNAIVREGTILLGLNGEIHIGENTVITQHCHIDGPTTIGKGCIIGPHTVMVTHDHDYDNTSGMIHNSPGPVKPIKIGNNCYIGAGVTIIQGVTIGESSVIGAGSLVTRDIPSGVVAYGNPCRVKRKRGERDDQSATD